MAVDSVARALALSAKGSAGTTDYNQLTNKPKINSVELLGNKTGNDLLLEDVANKKTVIDATTLASDIFYPTTKAIYDYAEDKNNKSTDYQGDKASTTKYYAAKTTYDAIEEVREIAAGKSTNYSISTVDNASFKTDAETVVITSIKTTEGDVINFDKLKIGDNVFIVETEYPDRWVSAVGTSNATCHKLETVKGITEYVKNAEVNSDKTKLTLKEVNAGVESDETFEPITGTADTTYTDNWKSLKIGDVTKNVSVVKGTHDDTSVWKKISIDGIEKDIPQDELPDIASNNNKYLRVNNDASAVEWNEVKEVPVIAAGDAKKALKVKTDESGYQWEAISEVPAVGTEDKDKYLHTNATSGNVEWTTVNYEDKDNKKTVIDDTTKESEVFYPTTKAVYEYHDATKEDVSNKVTAFQTVVDDTHYPSEKLVKDSLDNKLDKNADITAATKCKITYDAKGLVTAGADLTADDIPDLTLAKITDVTATAAEVNVLDGITATTTELNYTDGVTSNIQTQLDAKQAKLPAYTSQNGKYLRVNAGQTDVEWSEVREVPAVATADKDKYLHANATTGNLEWRKVSTSVQRVDYNLLATGWSGRTYSFESTYPVAQYDLDLELGNTATTAQYTAYGKAIITGSSTSNVITALGDVPAINIPVLLTVREK